MTREGFVNIGRITELMESGKLFEDLGVLPLNAANDRVTLCGSLTWPTELPSTKMRRGR